MAELFPDLDVPAVAWLHTNRCKWPRIDYRRHNDNEFCQPAPLIHKETVLQAVEKRLILVGYLHRGKIEVDDVCNPDGCGVNHHDTGCNPCPVYRVYFPEVDETNCTVTLSDGATRRSKAVWFAGELCGFPNIGSTVDAEGTTVVGVQLDEGVVS